MKPKEIGRIGAGKRKPGGKLDVAMIQSLVRKDQVDDIVAAYGHVIVDECHHVPAMSFERVMRQVKARYITGLTATPRRRDGHHPILQLQLATGRFIGEGFDDARLDTLFLALPVSWKGTLVQYAGRLHRSHQAKVEVRMMD